MTSVVDLVDRAAANHPDRLAVVGTGQPLTYGELRDWSDSVAADLRSAGVRSDDVVPVYAKRVPAMVAALIGIMKAGGAYLPLDHRYPADRIARLVALADSPVHLVVGDVPIPAEPGSHPVVIDKDWSMSGPVPAPRPGSRAYVIATSGSTGHPKPVVTTHENLSNFISGFSAAVGLDSADVVLARTSLSFDPHVVELLLPLTLGARVVVLPAEACADPAAVRAAVTEHGVTVVQATPSLWRALVRESWPPGTNIKALCGGEAMTSSLKDAILSIPGARLWNLYGPTETTVWCSALELNRDSPPEIGPPIAGLHFEVRASDGAGSVGELYIAGGGLAEGYLGATDLTAARFVREGRRAPLDRWYRTGDLVRVVHGGRMEFLGRADRQIKIRGYRVELGDVESAIASCPGVQVVVVVADAAQSTLVACVVGDRVHGEADFVRLLREHAVRELPSHLRPIRYVIADAIPLTPTEKVDVSAILELARPDRDPQIHGGGDVADSVEAAVRAIWIEVTGTTDITDDDRWEDIGGNSLSLLDLRMRVARAFGVDVPVSAVASNVTVGHMARLIEQHGNRVRAPAGGVDDAGMARDVPLVPSQLRFLAETPAAFWNENVLEVLLEVEASASDLVTAVRQILARHDAFHISSVDAARRIQRIEGRVTAEVTDVTDLHENRDGFIKAASGRRDLIALAGPLALWWVFGTEKGSYVHACLHHLVGDELSLHALTLELSSLLAGQAGRALPASASLAEWVGYFGSDQARARHRTMLPLWDSHTSGAEVDPSVVGRAEAPGAGRSIRRELAPIAMPDLPARERQRLLLAAAVHAAGEALGLQRVGCRVVDSGRGISEQIDDSLTIGWLAHHYPITIPRRDHPRDTLIELDAVQESIGDRGQSYLWLRHVDDAPTLRSGALLDALPLYFNYLPRLSRPMGLKDVSHLLPARPRNGSITGFALVVRESATHAVPSLWLDPGRLPADRISAFENLLTQSVETLLSQQDLSSSVAGT